VLTEFSVSLAEAEGKLRQPRLVGLIRQEIGMASLFNPDIIYSKRLSQVLF
jgi:hypothetical protein